MKSENLFDMRIQTGQGKNATTLLTEDGCYYPVIHEAYSHRSHISQPRSPSAPNVRRGDRPMHRTTMTISKPPWEPDYTTTSKQYYSGSKDLEPVRRPPLCPSMHRSQIKLGSTSTTTGNNNGHGDGPSVSDHMATYQPKDIIPANRLHLLSFKNRMDQAEGANMKAVVNVHASPSYWSQYNRVHNKLGALLGPGVAREYPVRKQYNVLTGEEMGASWKPENPRVSGNRVLHGIRNQINSERVLF